MRTVRSVAGASGMPVLVASGLIQATHPTTLDDPKLREVLFSPLPFPARRKVVPLPYRLDRQSITYLERVLPAALENQTRFLFVGRSGSYLRALASRAAGRPADSGPRSLGNFGNISVYLLARPAVEAHAASVRPFPDPPARMPDCSRAEIQKRFQSGRCLTRMKI